MTPPTDPVAGLSAEAAAERLAADGPNELDRGPASHPVRLFVRQFTSP